MSPTLRNILAVLAGALIGATINMSIIKLGPYLISPPEGVNPEDINSIRTHASAYGPIHFVIPFVAHALHSLIGAFTAVKLGVSHHRLLAVIVGGIAMTGGVMMASMLPEFLTFSIIDIALAYIPMALLGWRLAR